MMAKAYLLNTGPENGIKVDVSAKAVTIRTWDDMNEGSDTIVEMSLDQAGGFADWLRAAVDHAFAEAREKP